LKIFQLPTKTTKEKTTKEKTKDFDKKI